MDNTKAKHLLHSKLLSQKISADYAIALQDYSHCSDPADIIMSAYKNATELFDPDSNNSIASKTLSFYINNLDDILDEISNNNDSLRTISILLPKYLKIQTLIYESPDSLMQKLSSELIKNREYYKLFDPDYYIELSRISGVAAALKELEEDVNIRANTYYGTAYKEYLDILPGFDSLFSQSV